jgi:hypothetical protein
MVRVTDVDRADPLEIRVLETLTSGPLSAAEVAMRVWESEPVVTPVLEQSVLEQNVTRLKLGKTAEYSLTPKGLHTLGVSQGAQGAVDSDGRVPTPTMISDLHAAGAGVTESPPGLPTAIDPNWGSPAMERVPEKPAARKVLWRHVAYAVAYVLLGVFLLLALHSAIGVASILVGLGLGAWTLRPLYVDGGR